MSGSQKRPGRVALGETQIDDAEESVSPFDPPPANRRAISLDLIVSPKQRSVSQSVIRYSPALSSSPSPVSTSLNDDDSTAGNNKHWQVVLRDPQHQNVVVYDKHKQTVSVLHSVGPPRARPPRSHATQSHSRSPSGGSISGLCPTCGRFPSRSPGQSLPVHVSPQTSHEYFSLLSQLTPYPDEEKRLGDGSDASTLNARFGDVGVDSTGEAHRGGGGQSGRYERESARDTLRRTAFNTGYYSRFFEEEKTIGRGTFGGVYLAHHVLDDIVLGTYACKKIPVGDTHELLVHTIKEVKTLELLHHPNVVDYKHTWLEMFTPADFGPEVPCLFILMEYANYGNLADYIWKPHRNHRLLIDESKLSRRQKAKLRLAEEHSELRYLSDKEVWRFLGETCQGLQHLHSSGIIHRDIKPENLLLTVDPRYLQTEHAAKSAKDLGEGGFLPVPLEYTRLLISDFGQSRLVDMPVMHSGNTGTLLYCAPEMLLPRKEFEDDEKCDVWSTGMVLYAMCYGKLPFDADSPQELHKMISRTPITYPKNPIRPKAMVDLLKSMLSLDPEGRPDLTTVMETIAEASHSSPTGNAPAASSSTSSSAGQRRKPRASGQSVHHPGRNSPSFGTNITVDAPRMNSDDPSSSRGEQFSISSPVPYVVQSPISPPKYTSDRLVSPRLLSLPPSSSPGDNKSSSSRDRTRYAADDMDVRGGSQRVSSFRSPVGGAPDRRGDGGMNSSAFLEQMVDSDTDVSQDISSFSLGTVSVNRNRRSASIPSAQKSEDLEMISKLSSVGTLLLATALLIQFTLAMNVCGPTAHATWSMWFPAAFLAALQMVIASFTGVTGGGIPVQQVPILQGVCVVLTVFINMAHTSFVPLLSPCLPFSPLLPSSRSPSSDVSSPSSTSSTNDDMSSTYHHLGVMLTVLVLQSLAAVVSFSRAQLYAKHLSPSTRSKKVLPEPVPEADTSHALSLVPSTHSSNLSPRLSPRDNSDDDSEFITSPFASPHFQGLTQRPPRRTTRSIAM